MVEPRQPIQMKEPDLQIDMTPIEEDVGRLRDFDQSLEPNMKMLDGIQDDVVPEKMTSLDAYIEQRISAKMGGVQREFDEMIDNFHLELIRQFTIQQGTVDDLLKKYMLDPDTML